MRKQIVLRFHPPPLSKQLFLLWCCQAMFGNYIEWRRSRYASIEAGNFFTMALSSKFLARRIDSKCFDRVLAIICHSEIIMSGIHTRSTSMASMAYLYLSVHESELIFCGQLKLLAQNRNDDLLVLYPNLYGSFFQI